MDEYASKLAEELSGDYTKATEALRNERSEPNPIRRLVAALTPLLGRKARTNIFSMVDSTLSVERPNGLARKRQTTRGTQVAGSERRQLDVRSLAFTDSVLDYLVHLHLLRTGNKPGIRSLSLRAFLDTIRTRYGFHVDTAPTGMTISNDLLQSNRMVLERRLLDLGLLVGVNDAEAMKRLRPRFEPVLSKNTNELKTGAPGRFDRHCPVASPRSGACRRRRRRFGFSVRAGKTTSSKGMPRSRVETWIQAPGRTWTRTC